MRKTLIPALLAGALLVGCGAVPEQTAETVPTETATAVPAETTDAETTAAKPSRTTASTMTTAATSTTTTTTTAATTLPPTEAVQMACQPALEAGTRVTVRDLITETNVDLAAPDSLVDTTTLGEHTVTVAWTQNGVPGETALTYLVQDTQPPVILNTGAEPYVKVGAAFDIGALVGIGDVYDPTPTLIAEGYIDTAAPGSYPITVTATDSSGNAVTWDLAVQVVDSVPGYAPYSPVTDFAAFAAGAGAGGRCGIDVSKWQGNIDFDAVRDAGCSFVLMRIGYGDTGGTADEWYDESMRKATAAGLDVGVYFYSTASTTEAAAAQANWIADRLGGAALQLPVAFDWESFKNFQRFGISLRQLNDIYAAFADTLAARGYETMLYGSRDYLQKAWEVEGRTVWLAHYTSQTNYAGPHRLWQACDNGRIPGISGAVDLNVLYD